MRPAIPVLVILALFLAACTGTVETQPLPAVNTTDEPTPEEVVAQPPMVGEPVGTIAEDTPAVPDAPSAPQTPSGITRAELAEHNTKSDCWVGYKGTVYDLTAWLREHPGGSNAIAQHCGTVEAFSEAYDAQHRRRDSTRIANRGATQGTIAE